jgi:putative ABC transport system substrate-binding protein
VKLRGKIYGSAGRSLAGVWAVSALVLLWLVAVNPAPGIAAPEKPFRIGALTASWGPTPQMVGLQQGLKELGYVENVDYILGIRFTQGSSTELQRAARDLLGYGVDLIFCESDNAAKAASDATQTIPIVFTSVADPIGNGLIESYARPGGNVTGLSNLNEELSARRLQLFQQTVPGMKQVLLVHDSNDDSDKKTVETYQKAANLLGISLLEKGVTTEAEAGRAILNPGIDRLYGFIASQGAGLNILGFMAEATRMNNIPSMFGSAFMVEQGGFASYGPSWHEAGRLAARLVDKIIKGANPGEIPVEVNTKLEFVINLKVARKLGLKIDPVVLYLADRIIR